MTPINEPVKWDRTIWQGTDMSWQLRRLREDGTPVVPTEARAQVRAFYGHPVWLDASSDAQDGTRITIDPEAGWVSILIPEDATAGPEWDTRSEGVWDVEAVVDGVRGRWAMGSVRVSQDVTR